MKNSFLVIIELGIKFPKVDSPSISKVSEIVKAHSFKEAFEEVKTYMAHKYRIEDHIPDYACIVDMRDLGIDREPA